jgi:3-phosphoshikimate 1-carboxyvinyltransferase
MPSSTAVTISPAGRVQGRLTVPGDKAISHRYALLAALAQGRSAFSNFAPGADCQSTLGCLARLRVEVQQAPDRVVIVGRGLGQLGPPLGDLDAGNSGTTMRMLAGVMAGHAFASRFVGDRSLSGRPMRRVIAPLERMGARIDSTDGHAPLVVHGGALHAIEHHPDVPSAQVKTAVLLAGLHADGTTRVVEPAATRDRTERALVAFGGHVDVDGLQVSVTGGQTLTGRTLPVPGDFSSAAYWLVAAATTPGSRVEIENVGLNPSRTSLLDILRRFGARVRVDAVEAGDDAGEAWGTIVVEHDQVRPISIAPHEVPGLIDELPAIAALASGGTEVSVSGAGELRVKESDRIAVLVQGFRAMGFDGDESADGFVIASRGRVSGGVTHAGGDHRMAMAFAVGALAGERPTTIDGADAVVISYPGFFDTLGQLTTSSPRPGVL